MMIEAKANKLKIKKKVNPNQMGMLSGFYIKSNQRKDDEKIGISINERFMPNELSIDPGIVC